MVSKLFNLRRLVTVREVVSARARAHNDRRRRSEASGSIESPARRTIVVFTVDDILLGVDIDHAYRRRSLLLPLHRDSDIVAFVFGVALILEIGLQIRQGKEKIPLS